MADGGARRRRRRPSAWMTTLLAGQALAKAILMRRTLTVTTAPIFNSFSRIVPAVAMEVTLSRRASAAHVILHATGHLYS